MGGSKPMHRNVSQSWMPTPWLAVVAFIISFTTFYLTALASQAAGAGCIPDENPWYLPYQTLRLFVVEGEWLIAREASGPWCATLKAMAFVLPAISVLSIVLALSRSARRKLVRPWWRIWTRRGTVIVGNTPASRIFAADLKDDALGAECERHPIVLDVDPDAEHAEGLWRLKATVVPCPDGLGVAVKRSLDIVRTDRVISFLGEEDSQISLLLAIHALCRDTEQWKKRVRRRIARGPDTSQNESEAIPPIDIWLYVHDPVRTSKILSLGRLTQVENRVRLGTFDFDTLASRGLFERTPFELVADYQGQTAIHFAIHGAGAPALALAREAAHHFSTTSSAKLAITFVGPSAANVRVALLRDAPGLHDIVDLQAIARLGEAPPTHPYTAHFVVSDDEPAAVADAVRIRRSLLEPAVEEPLAFGVIAAPVYVRVQDGAGFGRLLGREGRCGPLTRRAGSPVASDERWPADGVHGYGALEECVKLEQIASPEIEAMARRAHDIAYGVRSIDQELDQSEWTRQAQNLRPALGANYDSLSHELRESNRRAVRHAPVKARALRCSIRRVRHGKRRQTLSPSEWNALLHGPWLDRLAEAEHRRWWAERAVRGWVHGEGRSEALRHHPELRPFKSLGRHEIFDRRQISSLPLILDAGRSAAGERAFGLRPELVVGVIGYTEERLTDIEGVRRALRAALKVFLGSSAGSPVGFDLSLLSNLAPGTDAIAVEIAAELQLPVHAILPMPVELYAEYQYNQALARARDSRGRDAAAKAARDRFLELTAKAAICVNVSPGSDAAAAPHLLVQDGAEAEEIRKRLYRRAGSCVVARSDILICVVDPDETDPSLTKELMDARKSGRIWRSFPESQFQIPPAPTAPLILDARDPQPPSEEAIGALLAEVWDWRTSASRQTSAARPCR